VTGDLGHDVARYQFGMIDSGEPLVQDIDGPPQVLPKISIIIDPR
jgi:hypothetical protein